MGSGEAEKLSENARLEIPREVGVGIIWTILSNFRRLVQGAGGFCQYTLMKEEASVSTCC